MSETKTASFTQTGEGLVLHTDTPLFGDVSGSYELLSDQAGKYGSPASFLMGAVMACYCDSLSEAVLARGGHYKAIRARAEMSVGKDDKGVSRIESMHLFVTVDADDSQAEIIDHCLSIVRSCTMSRSCVSGFDVSIDAARA